MRRCALNHLACAKLQGSAAVKIVEEKYSSLLNDFEADAAPLKNAILNKFGICVDASITGEGILMKIKTHFSALTLLKAFKAHGAIMKADSSSQFSMFIPTQIEKLQLL
jgi:hypothetical protein